MYSEDAIRRIATRKLFASMPPEALEAYSTAQADFKSAMRSVANVHAVTTSERSETAETERSAAALVLSNAIAERRGLHTRQSDVARAKVSSHEKTFGRKTQFDAAADLIGDKLEKARARKQTIAGPVRPEPASLADAIKEAAK